MRSGADACVAAMLNCRRIGAGLWLALLATGVSAQTVPWPGLLASGDGRTSNTPAWTVELLPEQRFPATNFRLVDDAGRQALRIEADGSYGNLVQRLDGLPGKGQLGWRWRVEAFNQLADLRRKETDDTSIKVCVLFDMPIDRVPFIERQLLRLAISHSGRDLPAATLCYVWDARLAPNTRIDNAYSRRVRYMVLRSGSAVAGSWAQERRDLGADFLTLFGDESAGQVPRLLAVAVGADADNTGGRSIAWIADLRLAP